MTGGRLPALSPLLAALVASAVIGCSDFNEQGGVISIEVQQPTADSLEVGDSLQLHARALDRNGDSVAAELRWVTSDTSLAVDSVRGVVTGVAPCAGCAVRAHEGSLYTSPLTLRVVARADTLVVGTTSLTVAAESTASAALDARILGGTPPAGVAGRRLIYTVVAPAFADLTQRTVELLPGAVVDTAISGADGAPTIPVTLSRIAGVAAPESAVVQVDAQRLSGQPLPGSGQRFTIHFLP